MDVVLAQPFQRFAPQVLGQLLEVRDVEQGQHCAEFSNIAGLRQLHFPKGNISALFEDVRRVLEREGLI
ncbi:MAG: hypothetical protein NTV14_10235 [Coprothermobacterota bacterium]|nr:hypothetical protein [Coprothermobacterota bacterium]